MFMKKFYLQILFLCLCVGAFAQLPDLKPVLDVTAPAGLVGTLNSGRPTNMYENSSTNPAWGYFFPNLTATVKGDVIIGLDSTQSDSTKRLECCTTITNNVKGKFVLIRRGTCNTSVKALLAQKAGAIGVIAYLVETVSQTISSENGFSAGDTSVHIPVSIISYADAQKLIISLKAGTTVSVNYRGNSLVSPGLYDNFITPLKQIRPLNINIAAPFNSKVGLITGKLSITEPDGVVKTITPTVALASNNGYSQNYLDSVQSVIFPAYTPTKKGLYQVIYTNDKNADFVIDSFRTNDYIFQQDQTTLVGASRINATNFAVNLKWGAGHIFYTGNVTDKATHGMFEIYNAKDLPVGDPITVVLFEFNDALNAKLQAANLDFSDLTIVASGDYKVTGKETTGYTDSLLTVEFKTPATLKPNASYGLVAYYDVTAGSGATPTNYPYFVYAGKNPSSNNADDITYAYLAGTLKRQSFFTNFFGQPKFIVRLGMAGFKPGTTGTNDLAAWAENQVVVLPNPVSTQLTLNFDLQTLNPTVDYLITSVEGLEIKAGQFKNVQTGTQTINVSDFANGLYFVRLLGSDGWRTKAFVVTK